MKKNDVNNLAYVYHGSSNGNIRIFEPREPNDQGTNPENKHKGVYASDDKKWAYSQDLE